MRYKTKLLLGVFALGILFLGCYVLIISWIQNKDLVGQQDEHNCLVSVGYKWNSTEQMCVKEWEKIDCTEDLRKAGFCAEIYNPVCGFPLKQTFSNKCLACLNENILYYTNGICQ